MLLFFLVFCSTNIGSNDFFSVDFINILNSTNINRHTLVVCERNGCLIHHTNIFHLQEKVSRSEQHQNVSWDLCHKFRQPLWLSQQHHTAIQALAKLPQNLSKKMDFQNHPHKSRHVIFGDDEAHDVG